MNTVQTELPSGDLALTLTKQPMGHVQLLYWCMHKDALAKDTLKLYQKSNGRGWRVHVPLPAIGAVQVCINWTLYPDHLPV